MTEGFSKIEQALEDIKKGKMVILVDDEDRENEGDLVCAAQFATPETVNFMATHGRGLICVPLSAKRCDELALYPQTSDNTTPFKTAFTVSVDAAAGITTGISASDRSATIQKLVDPAASSSDFVRPGHIFPLRARDGGVLVRGGQTEGALDMVKLAGLKPGGVICEIMNDDGTMARLPDLIEFGKKHDMKIVSVASLIEYRLQRESQIQRVESVNMPTDYGQFRLIAYQSITSPEPHLAVCKGRVGELDENGKAVIHNDPVLIRVHSECMTGDLFHSQRCECGYQLISAMEMIEKEGKGAVIYLRQEGRGIGLINKIKAYKLQEQGLDTVEANSELGFMADKRDYGIGAQICRDLGLRNVKILTNNPKKVSRLEIYGIKISEQIPLLAVPSEHNRDYLKAKKHRLGHLLDKDI